MKNIIFLCCLLFTLTTTVYSQPFVDLLNIRYTSAFQSKNKSGTPFSHIYIGSDLPLKLKNNVLIVFSPFYENWNIDSASNKKFLPLISCIALPVSVVIPFNKKHWSLTVTAIPRFNNQGLKFDNSFQMGGALLASEFGATGVPWKNFTYKTKVHSDSPKKKIEELIRHTDKLAQIQNTLKKGIEIT